MALQFTTSYIDDSIALLRHYKKLTDGAMAQVTDEQLYEVLDGEMNSIAVIVKHMAGNMRSRWTDFLTSDGEKPDRNRDSEFLEPPAGREALMDLWEQGWNCVFQALEPLTDGDLTRTITIRGEAHSVMQAINSQVAHYSYHCGQIVFLAKHFRGADWQSLSVPRGASARIQRKSVARRSEPAVKNMATLGLIEYADASSEVRAVYDDIMSTRQTDYINNFWKALAHDPATLRRTWESIKQIMAPGALDPLTKEMIYVAISASNQCGYCIASHTVSARKAGMTDAQFAELMAVVGMANETNRLSSGYQVEIDDRFKT